MNPILITYFRDGEKLVSSFMPGITEKEALTKITSTVAAEEIKRYFFIENPDKSVAAYQNYFEFDEEKQELIYDEREHIIQRKMVDIREIRNTLLKELDVPFMRAVEEKSDPLQERIKYFKNFLRNITEDLPFDDIESNEDLWKYNPFNNIMSISILETGSDYTEPPKISIEPPENDLFFGFGAEAVAFIKDGSVSRVEITNNGCGYLRTPYVEIEGNATIICHPPMNGLDPFQTMQPSPEEVAASE